MSTETTPQAPREERTDKKYYTASGEDITHIAAPAEKFVKKFCPAESEANNNESPLSPRTQAAILYTIRTALYDNNMRGYNFPWNTSDDDVHDDHNTAEKMVNERKNYQEATKDIPEEELQAIKELQEMLGTILSDGLAPNAAKYHVLARLEDKVKTMDILDASDKLNWISQKILASEKEIPRPVDAETVIEITQKILNSKLAELRGDTKERRRLEEEASVDMAGIQTLFNLDKSELLDQLYKEILTRIDTIYSDDELAMSQKQVALEEFAAVIDEMRVDMMIADEEAITALARLD
ncbi:hypothetical protein FBF28_01855 [Candidatus Saccharibacteria bacterium oral taxon 488]|nr:hypothetical protein FBF28_01855 [Candidatus Saccharibacteria bacterium oral taxon 488]